MSEIIINADKIIKIKVNRDKPLTSGIYDIPIRWVEVKKHMIPLFNKKAGYYDLKGCFKGLSLKDLEDKYGQKVEDRNGVVYVKKHVVIETTSRYEYKYFDTNEELDTFLEEVKKIKNFIVLN